MIKLSKRLAKLEATVQAKTPWRVSALEVNEVALAKLSIFDRELVDHARAHGGVTTLCDSRPTVWERWDAALGAAIEQTGFPVRVRAIDWEL